MTLSQLVSSARSMAVQEKSCSASRSAAESGRRKHASMSRVCRIERESEALEGFGLLVGQRTTSRNEQRLEAIPGRRCSGCGRRARRAGGGGARTGSRGACPGGARGAYGEVLYRYTARGHGREEAQCRLITTIDELVIGLVGEGEQAVVTPAKTGGLAIESGHVRRIPRLGGRFFVVHDVQCKFCNGLERIGVPYEIAQDARTAFTRLVNKETLRSL